MIVFGAFVFCLLYLLVTARRNFYRAWRSMIPAVAACHIALWSMPEISAMLEKFSAQCGFPLFQPFCRSAAILLTGTVVLIALRIVIGKIGPLADPEFPAWIDRPASLAARFVTALMIVTLLLQSGLVLPLAATCGEFQPTAKKADAIALFTSALLNRLSGQSSLDTGRREELAKRRLFSQREAERIAQREREEKARREKARRPTVQTQPEKSASLSGLFNRAKTQLRTVYDDHNRNLEEEMREPSTPQGAPSPETGGQDAETAQR